MTFKSMMLVGAAFALLAGCNGAGGAPAAPKTDAEKVAMADEIATLMSDPKMIDQMFDGMGAQAMMTLPDMCSTAPATEVAACQARMSQAEPIIKGVMDETMNEAKAMMPDLMKELGAIMAREYTGEELAVMKGFYGSPEGKSITQKQPAVMTEYMGKVMEKMQPMQMSVMQKMMERLSTMPEPTAPN
jgi:hypothetical protein